MPESVHNIDRETLNALLRRETQPRIKDGTPAQRPYALIDLGRLSETAYLEVSRKLVAFAVRPLLNVNGPRYEPLKKYGVILVSSPGRDTAPLLKAWGACDSDTISAWIVSELDAMSLAGHLRQTAFAYGEDKTRYFLRYYDPLVTPVLHRLADPAWARWFFSPMTAWWYPVATPQEERWSRIEGGPRGAVPDSVPLVLTEELWEALVRDPLPYRLVNAISEQNPAVFDEKCYGVRVARVESLLAEAKKHGLSEAGDLTAYVTAFLKHPERRGSPHWQAG
jgi:hypothetical protein